MNSSLPISMLSLVAVIAVAMTPRDAAACSCMRPGPPAEEAAKFDAVLVGTVDALEEQGMRKAATVSVERWLKGQGPGTVTVMTASSSAACGLPLSEGERFLLYASRRDKELSVGLCSRSRRVDAEAEAEIAELAALDPSASGAGGGGEPAAPAEPRNPSGEPAPPSGSGVGAPATEPPPQKRGCAGCRVASARPSGGGALAALLVAGVAWRRRRRCR